MDHMAEGPKDAAEEASEVPADPLMVIHNAIASVVDGGSLLTGYIVVAEWIEADGQPTMSVIHTPMTPWHFEGLMRYAKDIESSAGMVPILDFVGDDDEDDDDF